MSIRGKFGLAGFALVSAITLTLVSVSLERKGPDLAPYGNLCGPRHDDLCYEPQLKGGFPIAYLFDSPGTSVERNLGLEDRLVMGALILDIALYFIVVLLALWVVPFRWAKRYRRSCDPMQQGRSANSRVGPER
jgi:hypothetical protein